MTASAQSNGRTGRQSERRVEKIVRTALNQHGHAYERITAAKSGLTLISVRIELNADQAVEFDVFPYDPETTIAQQTLSEIRTG